MAKKLLNILLATMLILSGTMTAFAGQSTPSKSENVIKINLDDPNCPYLVDTEVIPDIKGSSKPTQSWNLYDNQYSWSARITGDTLYSNYYFTGHDGRFRLYAYEPAYSNVSSYSIKIFKRTTSAGTVVKTYSIPTNGDADFYNTSSVPSSTAFFFSISGGSSADFASDGFVDTY